MKNIFILLTLAFALASCQMNQKFESVEVDAFADTIKSTHVTILDVRTAEEYEAGHIEGAENMDVKAEDFKKNIQSLDKENTIAVYCRSGNRSKTAAKILAKAGYRVVELASGYNGWRMNYTYPIESFQTKNGKTLQIYLVNHGSLAMCYDGKWIQIDPVESFGDKKVDYGFFPKTDYIFVTHEHGDHLQKETIESLSKEDTKLYLNAASQAKIEKGEVVENGQKFSLGEEIDVEVWPAYNTTPDREKFHPKGNGNAYLFTFDFDGSGEEQEGLKVYVSGDTENIPEFAELRSKNIDVAFLSANQPYTMTPEQCVEAAKAIQPRVLIPYHLGQTDVQQIEMGLENTGIEVRRFQIANNMLTPRILDSRLVDGLFYLSVQPRGVCSQQIDIVLKDDVIQSVTYTGGCSGNTQGVAALLKGMTVDEAITRLEGIRCGMKSTSCPDQLAIALKMYGKAHP